VKSRLDRIGSDNEDDRYILGRVYSGARHKRTADGRNHGYALCDQFPSEIGKCIKASVSPEVFDLEVAAFNQSGFANALQK
jgi:hypothetical protein